MVPPRTLSSLPALMQETSLIAFGHGRVTQAALDDFYAREVQLVAPVTTATVALNRR